MIRRVPAAALLLGLLCAHSGGSSTTCPAELFRIANNRTNNVVLYEVNRTASGEINAREPVRASWLSLSDGTREGLNVVERAFAYGFEIAPAGPLQGWWLHLRGRRDRPIHIATHAGCLRALLVVAGREALLQRIFVSSDGAALIPRVGSVELTGFDAETGVEMRELVRARAAAGQRSNEPRSGNPAH